MESKPIDRSRGILYVPSTIKGWGTGHLIRCIAWSRESDRSFLYIPAEEKEAGERVDLLLSRFLNPKEARTEIVSDFTGAEAPFSIIVLDRRASAFSEYSFFGEKALVIGIDEGGDARGYIPYLIDILPSLQNRRKKDQGANYSSLSFLNLPGPPPDSSRRPHKALITFGGEDPAKLTSLLCRSLVRNGFFFPEELHTVFGPATGVSDVPFGVKVLPYDKDLRNRFSSYEYIFTSYGLTAFEAASAGCRVILLNPSKYHRSLSRLTGFTEIGVRNVNTAALRRAFKKTRPMPPDILVQVENCRKSLDIFLRSLALPRSVGCPLCGKKYNRAAAREEGRTFFRCSSCGIVYQLLFTNREEHYSKEYFFEEYRSQYGKTYLEDFEHIKGQGFRRLKNIVSAGIRNGKILDIGCAYGPFLQAAKERGFSPTGLDVSSDAAAYVRDTLNIPAFTGDFLSFEPLEEKGFDAVTLWYVLEHFPDPSAVLEKIRKILKPGGVLAFSTPSFNGISGKRDLRKFCFQSPWDHHTLWSPAAAAKVLRAAGFSVSKIVVTGHHPERFPYAGVLRKGLLYGCILLISRIFRLGDTFEIYARKTAAEGRGPGI